MSVQIQNHAHDLHLLLTELKNSRNVPISKSKATYRILSKLALTGKEDRPFTDSEIKAIIARYKYFEGYFTKLGLWPA